MWTWCKNDQSGIVGVSLKGCKLHDIHPLGVDLESTGNHAPFVGRPTWVDNNNNNNNNIYDKDNKKQEILIIVIISNK